jgi:hypothetical protein
MALEPKSVWLCVQQPFNTVNMSNLIDRQVGAVEGSPFMLGFISPDFSSLFTDI